MDCQTETPSLRIEDGDRLIRALTGDDFPLLLRWLTDERVLEFYAGRDVHYTPKLLVEHYREPLPDGIRLILEYRHVPIGYGQVYRVQGEINKEYDYPDTGRIVYAMDQFIGEPEYWNRGIGTAFLRIVAAWLKNEKKAERLLLDPRQKNPRAVRAYEKAGFRIIKTLSAHERFEGKDEDCWLMEKEL